MIQRQRHNKNNPNKFYFSQLTGYFLFEKSDLILENVSDKMSYPKQPVVFCMFDF